MLMPKRGVEIVQAMYDLHKDLANGDDGARRVLTLMMCEQFAYEFGDRWGAKAGAPNAPFSAISKDSIAYDNRNGSIDIFDWQNGSTRAPQLSENQPATYPNSKPQQGAYFIVVNAANHLEEVPPVEPKVDLDTEILKIVSDFRGEFQNFVSRVTDIMYDYDRRLVDIQNKSVEFPSYEGTIGKPPLSTSITLNPKKK